MTLLPGAIPLRERRTLGEEWAEFAVCIPQDARSGQVRDMKRAFYAGALAFHSLMLSNLDAGDDVTELDQAYGLSLQAELETFVRELGEGRA